MSHHPAAATLERFVTCRLPPAEARGVVVHLMGGCRSCRRQVTGGAPFLAAGWLVSGDPACTLAPDAEAAYDEAIRRAIDGVLLHGEQVLEHKAEARRLLLILRQTAGAGEPTHPTHRGCRQPLYEACLARSWELRFDDPGRTVAFAHLACQLAPDLGEDGYTAPQVADFAARAWGDLGNALRVAEDFAAAEAALRQAQVYWAEGTRDAKLEIRLLDFTASLHGSLKRNREAIATLTLVHAMCLAGGDRHGAGRALIGKAVYTGCGGEPAAALDLLRQALATIDRAREPELEVIAMRNQLFFLTDAGRYREARSFLWRHRPRLEERAGRLDRTKLVDLEGRIHAGLGQLARAENCFREARRGFAEAKLPVAAATAAIDLAAVCMRQGQEEEARELGMQAANAFMAQGIEGEGLAAVVTLLKTFELRVATSALVERVAGFLRRFELDHSAQFESRTA